MHKHSIWMATALLAGCAQLPVGPTIASMPAPGKPFEAFIVDAVLGTALGAGAGSGMASGTAWTAQRRYDVAYQQCMYAKGNVIPGYYPYPAPPPPPEH
jgi:hypothetical protein